MLNFYCSTKVKIRLDVAAKLLGRLKSSKSIDSVKKGWVAVILCLALVFPAAGFSVPQTVQADDGGYLLDKTITWADGSTEHIQIGDDGYFILDGVKKRLVGFDLGIGPSYDDVDRYWLPGNLARMDKTLAYMESVGIRIITFNPRYIGSWNEMGNEGVIYPKAFDLIYNHKMLVIPHLVTNYLTGADNFETLPWSWTRWDWTDDTTSFTVRFVDAIKDYPNIVACVLGNELNKPIMDEEWCQPPQDYSPQQAANYFNYTRNIVAPKMPNIPIVQNLIGCTEWWASPPEMHRPDIMEAVLPVTDHPYCTMYAPSLDSLDYSISTYLSWLGGMGYPTTGWWIGEFNKVEGSGVADFTVYYLEHAFNYGASVILLHTSISPDNPGYSFFNNNGDPTPSLVAIGREVDRLQSPIVEPSSPPTLTTNDTSNVTNTGTTLNGNLSNLGSASTVDVSFQWGTSSGDYTSETIPQALDTIGPFNFDLTGLSPGTAYYFRAKAVGHGTHYGDEKSFTTGSVNQPPVLNPIGNKAVNEGELLQFTISATDPDDDPLTYSASDLPQGASFDPQTKTFSWTPDEAGTFPSVHFEVSDGELTDSEDITITVGSVNQPPVLNPIGNKAVNEGELLQFTIWATDPDDDPLTYSASDLPQGASFDPQTKTFSWTPDEAGTFPNVHFEVSDGELTDSEDITITVNAVSSPPRSGGGGGGGGGATKETTLVIDLEGALGEAKIQGLKGLLLAPLAVTSPDALITFQIALHTKALTSGGDVVNKIQMQKLAQPPPVPATCGIVGDAYEFTPAGTTFNPPANLTLTYDPSDIPEGIPEENLSIAYWDAATDKWISLPSTVNPATHTVTAKVSHFTVFAIIGLRPPVANFKCSALTISPDKVGAGETVNVSISVSNVGGAAGSCKLTLKIDGVVEATKEVTADAGATKEVSFSIVEDTAGTYIVDVNSITGSFVVKAGPTPEISMFGVTPNYHGETHKLAFARVIYEVNNLYEAMADAELTLKVSLDSEPLEEVSLLSLSRLELGEITGSRDYIPPRGWKSGTYTFQAELYVGGKLYATTTEEEMEVSAPVVNWVTLGKIIGAALILIAFTVFAILLRRRRLLQRLGQR